jgi:hypothetical protein
MEREPTSPWMDRRQAARYLGIKGQTLARMAVKRCGPEFSKPSRRVVRYHADSLDKWLRQYNVSTGTK